MATDNIFRHLRIDDHSVTPKYLQLTNAILKGIEAGHIGKDYPLPSINDLSYEMDISRDTAEKAYRHLKGLGIVGSVPGKGYFIARTDFIQAFRIFLLFNKLSQHKKIIYDALVKGLGERAAIDFYIYNNDYGSFKKLLTGRQHEYTHYVIIPHFMEGGESAHELINGIKGANLILLDKLVPGITRPFGAVYENFEKDIFHALEKALPQLEKYQALKIIFPGYTYFPEEILDGFRNFCRQYAFNYKVVHRIADEPVNSGDVFINLMEDDLVVLLDKIRQTALQPGRDVGIISYNETPLKRFILDGITTISTNFEVMGSETARMILSNELGRVEVPFTLTLRPSL